MGKILPIFALCCGVASQEQVFDCADDLGLLDFGPNDTALQLSGTWNGEGCRAYTRPSLPGAYFTFRLERPKKMLITSDSPLAFFRIHDEASKDIELVAIGEGLIDPEIEPDKLYAIEARASEGAEGFRLSLGCDRRPTHFGVLRGELSFEKTVRWYQSSCFSHFRPERFARYFSFETRNNKRLLICARKAGRGYPHITLFRQGSEFREVLESAGRRERRRSRSGTHETCLRQRLFAPGIHHIRSLHPREGPDGSVYHRLLE